MLKQPHCDRGIPAALKAIESPLAQANGVDLEIDARHLGCPLPLLKAKQGLRNLAVGQLMRVLATDSGSLQDFVSFTQLTGQLLEGFWVQDACYYFVIRKQV